MKVNPAADERLALSRACLRQAMSEITTPPSRAERADTNAPGSGWRTRLMQTPATRLLLALGQAWWMRQPLRLVLPLIEQAAQVLLAPTAQRHPVGLVLGAATVGAALVMARPWRWLPATAVLARLLPQLLSEIAKSTTAHSPAAPTAITRAPAR